MRKARQSQLTDIFSAPLELAKAKIDATIAVCTFQDALSALSSETTK
jgi:hypothetical protein